MAPQTQSEYKLNVAICGGGLGGLGLAFMLSKYAPNVKVDVYEATALFSEIGLGVALSWRSSLLMTVLDLKEDITAIGGQFDFTRLPRTLFWSADRGHREPIPVSDDPQRRFIGLHRAQFHSVLLNRLGTNCTTYTSKRLTSYTQPEDSKEPIQLFFADGTKAICDVLIGADGLKSAVRGTMVAELAAIADASGDSESAAKWRGFAKPTFSGAFIYRALFPAENLERLSPNHSALADTTAYVGKDHFMISYTITRQQGRFNNMAVFHFDPALEGTQHPEPWVSEVEASKAVHWASEWDKDVQDLVAGIDGPMKKWIVNVVRGLPTFAHGRIAILGDAAHAMTPFLGSGAGQAFEDAITLAKLLAHPLATRDTVQQALRAYSQIRQPIAQLFFERSRDSGMLYSYNLNKKISSEEFGALSDAYSTITAEGDPMKDVEEAMELFKTLVA